MHATSGKWLLAAFAFWLCLAGGSRVRAQSEPPASAAADSLDAGALRLALLVFIAQVGTDDLPVNVYGLRYRLADELSVALQSSGFGVCANESVEVVMQAQRIRNSRHIESSALRALTEECGAEFVLVTQFYFFDRDMMLLGRMMSAGDAEIVWASAAESLVDVEDRQYRLSAAEFSENMGEMCREMVARLPREYPARRDRPMAALFPTTAGPDLQPQADLIMHAFLERLLGEDGYRIPDPGWIAAELRSRGVSPKLIGAEARRRLEEELGIRLLLFSELISYEPVVASSSAVMVDEVDAPGSEQFFAPFMGSLRATDAGTGDVLAFELFHAKRPGTTGIFGIEKEVSWVERFDEFAGELVSRLPHLEPATEVK